MATNARTLDIAKDTLLGRMGLIRVCKSILRGHGEPRLFSVTAIPAKTSFYMGNDIAGEAGAVGFTYEQAVQGAIGECVERYSCAVYDPDALVYASKEELGDEAVGMDAFTIHAPEQYDQPRWPFARWTPDKRIRWTEGKSLTTGQRRYIPACLVYVPYLPAKGEDILCLSVSSGQSCHTDRMRALLTGLYEVVERDAFMISWLRRLRLPRVDYLADPEVAAVYNRYFGGCELEFHVFDMTLDIRIPSYVCFAEGRSHRGPIIGMGASTRLSQREALTKAILEAAQDMVWCRDLIRRKADWRPEPGWTNIRDFEDHVRLYCEPDMRPALSFLLDSPARTKLDPAPDRERSSEEMLTWCVDHLRDLGLEAIVVDTTAPDVASAGFYSPKIFIPGTVPLTAVHRLQALGSPRLRAVPPKMPYESSEDFNPFPHPFP